MAELGETRVAERGSSDAGKGDIFGDFDGEGIALRTVLSTLRGTKRLVGT